MNNKEAKVLLSESPSGGRIAWAIASYFIIAIILYVITAICALIPLIGLIIGPILGILSTIFNVINFVSTIFVVIGMARSKATLTEDGIFGNKYCFGEFDVTFDKIKSFSYSKGMITINCINGVGKKEKIKVYGIANAKAFYKACKDQLAKPKAAPVEAEA